MLIAFTEHFAGEGGMLFGVITALLSGLSAYFAARAKKESAQANDAVNHRHLTGTPRLYDLAISNATNIGNLVEMVSDIQMWKNEFAGGPLDDGEKARQFVNETRESLKNIDDRLSAHSGVISKLCETLQGRPCVVGEPCKWHRNANIEETAAENADVTFDCDLEIPEMPQQ